MLPPYSARPPHTPSAAPADPRPLKGPAVPRVWPSICTSISSPAPSSGGQITTTLVPVNGQLQTSPGVSLVVRSLLKSPVPRLHGESTGIRPGSSSLIQPLSCVMRRTRQLTPAIDDPRQRLHRPAGRHRQALIVLNKRERTASRATRLWNLAERRPAGAQSLERDRAAVPIQQRGIDIAVVARVANGLNSRHRLQTGARHRPLRR